MQLEACVMRGDVRGYVKAFRQRLNRCSDVGDDEAHYRFVRGLSLEAQRFVRLARPNTFEQAATTAEQLAPTRNDTRATSRNFQAKDLA